MKELMKGYVLLKIIIIQNKKIEINTAGFLRKKTLRVYLCVCEGEDSNEFAVARNIFGIPFGKIIHKKNTLRIGLTKAFGYS